MQRHELSAAQWAGVEAVLPRRVGRPSKAGDRHFVNAVLWIAKTGSPWRDLHPRFGPWKTIYNRFRSWARQGLWNRVFLALRVDVDPDGSIADATIVRSHQHAAGGKGGSTRTPLAALAEASPPRSTLSWTLSVCRSTSSSRQVRRTRPRSPARCSSTRRGACSSRTLVCALDPMPPPRGTKGAAPLPRDRGSPHGAPRGLPRLRGRNLASRAPSREGATRYDKTTSSFAGFIHLACACMWLS